MKATKIFTEFFESEKAGGLILLACTALSLLLANLPWGESYLHLWHIPVGPRPLEFWINDGLMTIFFLLVGLEIEREIYIGEFSEVRKASLPIVAAIGGMIVPAGIHYLFNQGTDYQNGYGIPMATDIAFALGILSLLGKRVPVWIKLFLTALAIIDDLGAILIIAIFYSGEIGWTYLGGAALVFLVLLGLNNRRVYRIWIYLVIGILLWYCLYRAGIHPTITGVLLAFAVPFRDGGDQSPSHRLQHTLHRPVAFLILPLFALANTAIPVSTDSLRLMFHPHGYGIFFGLWLGKPAGIFLFSLLGAGLGLCAIPREWKKSHILGVGMLAGIGFTMSIFISLLAFSDPGIVNTSKLVILIASLVAGITGFLFLRATLPANQASAKEALNNAA